ncbi:NlpC/P60 family protein [Saccharothrix sp. NPDC042600]|uniref:NlpC/P60 family protein n=1 Tax=Saccharothrix sp. NPDC042600 TaxID=3154492 RepID=UPI0034009A2B
MTTTALTAVVLAALFPLPAGAQPSEPVGPSEGLARYWELSGDAERANGKLLAAQEEVQRTRAALAMATENSSRAAETADRARAAASASAESERQAVLARDRLQAEVDVFVEATHLGLRLDLVGAMLSSRDPVEFLGTASLLDSIAEDVAGTVQRHVVAPSAAHEAPTRAAVDSRNAEEAGKSAAEGAAEAQRAVDAAAAAEAVAAADVIALGARADAARRALAGLTDAERAALADPGPRIDVADLALPDGPAGDAVRFALRQVGKEYEWGGVGPLEYDCSGLTMMAYRWAGVTIPRVSEQQVSAGTPVALDDVRAGDLVVYRPDAGHVAMAIDGTWAVHAATEGEPIKVARIAAIGPINSIRRIID